MTERRCVMCELTCEDDLSTASIAKSHNLLIRMPEREPKFTEVVN
jgi:hypothetical protein